VLTGAIERPAGTSVRRIAALFAAAFRVAILTCALIAPAAAQAASVVPDSAAPDAEPPHAEVAQARDLASDGADARATGRVIVVLFSTAGCPWCQRVREEFLKPMQANEHDRSRIIVREIDIDARSVLTDFSGRATTHDRFALAHQIRFAPTIAFLGPDGAPLAEPLIGFRTADYFGYYLDARIETGLAKLRR
jgi:thioredoxin-related protein